MNASPRNSDSANAQNWHSATRPACVSARQRLLSDKHDPFLVACWERVVFLHYLIRPELLLPHVPEPFELDLYDSMACISVVAGTMRNFRASRSISTGWLLRPVQSEQFLNLRACVHLREEPGSLILWSWLSNPLRMTLPLTRFGFPCTFAEVEYDHRFEAGKLQGAVKMKNSSGASFEYRASLESQLGFEPCPLGSLAEFAMERYTAFFSQGSRQRVLRCWHPPWLQRPMQASIDDRRLITNRFTWFESARLVAANCAHGFSDVWIGRPRGLDSNLPDRHPVLSAFYEMP